jgi:DNA-directed RNA polymerase II subunit RPB2
MQEVPHGSFPDLRTCESWNDILQWKSPAGHSLIEYVDPTETENFYIAMTPEAFAKDATYTHMEIHPSTLLGTMASNIPFPDHNQAPRNSYQAAMGKQAMGIYALNFRERMDTMSNLLWYSTVPLASPFMSQFYKAQTMPSGFNIVVAIMTYGGYNQEDSVMINRAALDRGLFRSEFYRTYKDEEKKNQASGEEERFCVPNPATTKQMKDASYLKLGEDGLVPENVYVTQDDVLIGKVAPIRLRGADGAAMAGINHASLKAMSSVAASQAVDAAGGRRFRDVSKLMRTNEAGYVDRIYRGRNGEGYSFVKIRVREERVPVIGDKFSSRHGQKGTCGIILNEEDMPCTSSGLRPDIIMNPHAVPSRMTIAQLMETMFGKVCSEKGTLGDGTPYSHLKIEDLRKHMIELGMHPYGNEIMYNGQTGEMMEAEIFMGPTFYQRLKHMVSDKKHSRSRGPIVSLTRQPCEGRSRDGGLRVGEMERDCMLSHGASMFTKERLMDVSDPFSTGFCKNCGVLAVVNKDASLYDCGTCGVQTEFEMKTIPYAMKLWCQELEAMHIVPRLVFE